MARQILEQNGFACVWIDEGLNIDNMYMKETLNILPLSIVRCQ